ncbi:MAG TPA: aminotransferase class I/II-fold pyridoxal phosphate-dependent enzyme [Thermoanaerobaculia bacterium]|jgi:histidinol-phosphate aminotransferase|nr:aminotransferase class I/II-fold pyridoxal phosphate-dependent enzyme [Thermoanaerobaculia bacterium]
MTNPSRFVRPELRALGAYHLDLTPCRHKLDQNEVPWDLPGRLKVEMAERLLAADWARYPDFHADALRRDLAELHGHPAEGVLVGNGSNELLSVTLTALVAPGSEVLGAEPSFGLYRGFVLKAGGVPRFLPPRADLRLPAEELEAEVERDPRRPLLLCSPNNPTGDALPPERIERLLDRLEAPLLLDNAYGEFCRHDYRPLLARYPHLILFRTFSKAWSLAGIRLGYLLADPRLVTELIKVKLPYNLGHPAVILGRTALQASAEAERRVRILVARRPQWAAMLEEEGLEIFPSEANFLLVRSPKAREIRETLEARSIRVRDVSGYSGLAGCLRVSVGTGASLRAVRAALRGEPSPPGPFSRPLPSHLTGRGGERTDTGSPSPASLERGPGGEDSAGTPVRIARIERSTGETRIRLDLRLDGGDRRIQVPNGFFAHMLNALATHGGLGLDLQAEGDTHVDLHHTVEDVGIAFGEALAAALGERRGIVRFAHAYAPLDEALARAVVDLSGRGSCHYSAPPEVAAGWVTADFPLTLVADFFQAVADRGRLTLHLEILSARNGHHAAEAAFKAAALALRQAVALRAGSPGVPSTKGTLSA